MKFEFTELSYHNVFTLYKPGEICPHVVDILYQNIYGWMYILFINALNDIAWMILIDDV